MHVRLFAIAAVALSIGLIAGCGEDEEAPAQKSFKGVSEGDMESLSGVSAQMREFSAAYTDFIAASEKEDVDAAQQSVDAMTAAVDEARSAAEGIESDDLGATLDDYIGKMDDVGQTSGAVVDYFAEPSGGSAKQEKRLIADFEEAVLAARDADRDLLARIEKSATPEQRTELRKELEEAQQEFREKTGSGG
ncbi:MAG: hypothetical protein ABW060_04895 [Solirubrobacteraceae bacterium]